MRIRELLCGTLLVGLCAVASAQPRSSVEQFKNLGHTHERYIYVRVNLENIVSDKVIHSMELAKEWMEEQTGMGIVYSQGDLPPAPKGFDIEYKQQAEFFHSMILEGLSPEFAAFVIGYAHMEQHTGSVSLNWTETFCPAQETISLAIVQLHELGHNVGWYHPSDLRGSRIITQDENGKYNLMIDNISPHMRDTETLCDKSPSELTIADLGLADLDPIQRGQFYDFIGKGYTWRALESVQFDLGMYLMKLEFEGITHSDAYTLAERICQLTGCTLPPSFSEPFPREYKE